MEVEVTQQNKIILEVFFPKLLFVKDESTNV